MGIVPSKPSLTSGERLVLDQVNNFVNSGGNLNSITDEQRGQLERIFITDKLANPSNPDSSSYRSLREAINDNDPVVRQVISEIIADGPGEDINIDNSL